MELSQQVTNLQFSKRLCELGVKQVSLFKWAHVEIGTRETNQDNWGRWFIRYDAAPRYFDRTFAAFTVAELGELLPDKVSAWKAQDGKYWFSEAFAWDENKKHQVHSERSEVDARAKMLIYLIENGLLTV